MQEPIAALVSLGFGEYEAQAYAALLQHSPLNGYELAKASGVPRPNIYAVLQRLEEKGAVLRLETPSGARYAPVSPGELVARLGGRYQTALDTAKEVLAGLGGALEQAYVWNIAGYPALIEHAKSLVASAKESMLVGVWAQEAQALTQELAQAESRGVAMTTLCMAACPHNCGHCRGRIYPYRIAPGPDDRWLILVGDGKEALAAELTTHNEGRAVRTQNPLLVELGAGDLRQTIALATSEGGLGARLGTLLSPETKDTLANLGTGETSGPLGHMQGLFRP